MPNICKPDGLSPQSNDIIRLLSAIQSSSTTINIIKSLQRSRIITYFDGVLRCTVDLNYAKKVRHYQFTETKPARYDKTRIDLATNLLIEEANTFLRKHEEKGEEWKLDEEEEWTLDEQEEWTLDEQESEEEQVACGEEEGFQSQLQITLGNLFPNGTDHLVGSWKPWKN